MKGLVGFLFFMLFLAAFALVLLQGRQMAESTFGAGGAGITGIQWRPVRIAANEVPDDSGLFVMFAVDGGISGNGGCNTFFGSLEQEDDGIAVGPLGSTRRACDEPVMQREAAFLQSLESMTRLQKTDRGLQMLGNDGLLLAEFEPAASD